MSDQRPAYEANPFSDPRVGSGDPRASAGAAPVPASVAADDQIAAVEPSDGPLDDDDWNDDAGSAL